ncbi:MAG TPA: YHYH protein [Candidatus Paceibacterota bacterium]|nr:YHYH protein [Candidatus Paceibacterota bacterium]
MNIIEGVLGVVVVLLIAFFVYTGYGGNAGAPIGAPGGNLATATTTAPASAPAPQGTQTAPPSAAQATQPAAAPAATATAFDIHAIPLGDGKISTSPKAGYVYSCQTSFTGGGAQHAGDWIQGSTWNLAKKISVQGAHYWSNATFSDTFSGTEHLVTGNGLPVDEPTGTFPISPSDPAYQYDRNPNSIEPQDISYTLPANPIFAASSSCVPMGPVGIAKDGVAIYNALDAGGRDAVAHEIQDSCDGHPQSGGQYHYHGPSPCMPGATEPDAVVGYALDGFPITSMYDASGNYYTDAELDACHGTTSPIVWNGKTVTMYHYVLTQEYPYTVGCFRGTPVANRGGTGGKAAQQPSGGGAAGGPPPAAVAACSSSTSGASCSFTGAAGGTISGTCQQPPNATSLACVPG